MNLALAATLTAQISGTIALDPPDSGALSKLWVDATDANTGEGVAGAGVDPAGAYSIEGLPPGSYRVQVYPGDSGYVYEVWVPGADNPVQAPVYDWQQGAVLDVDALNPATGVDFLLDLGRRISGHVSLDGLSDVDFASVQADRTDGGFGWGSGTDGGGDYTIWGLPLGTYTVRVESSSVDQPFTAGLWQDKTLREDGDPVDVSAADAGGIDFVVSQERTISGQVFLDWNDDQVQQAGEPGIANSTVRVYDFTTGRWLGHAAMAEGGNYAIGVTPGVYRVEADPHVPNLFGESWQDAFFHDEATPVDVTAGDAAGVDFGLVAGTTVGTLRGRVIAADTLQPVAGVDVEAWRFSDGRYVRGGQTDAGGVFQLIVPSGSYRVVFNTQNTNTTNGTDYVSSYWPAQVDYPAVFGDGTDLGDVGLDTGGSISGTVTVPGGETLPLPFDVWPESFTGGDVPLPSAAVQADGSYHLRGLEPGFFRVQATVWGTGFVTVYYQDGAASTFDRNQAAPVEVSAGSETSGVDLHLDRGGSISGTVTRAGDGTPVAGVPIQVSLTGDLEGRGYWDGTQTAADGTYLLPGLPSGDYRVRTDDRRGELANAVYPTAVAVTAPSETSGVDFALTVPAKVRGRVWEDTDDDGLYDAGEGRADVLVQAADLATGEWLGDARSDGDGLYEIGGLGAGTYQVELGPEGTPFVRMWWNGRFDQPDPLEVPAVGGVPQDVSDVDFQVIQGTTISGTVFFDVDGDGVRGAGEAGVANAWVNARNKDGGPGAWGGSRADGTYILWGVLPGRYSVWSGGQGYLGEYWQDVYFEHEASVVDVSSGAAAGIDFSLRPSAGVGTLRGRLLAAGTLAPIAGADVQVWHFDTEWHVAGARTGADGRFAVQGLPPSPAAGYKVFFDTTWTNETFDTDFVSSLWAADGQPGTIDPNLLRVVFPTLPDPPSGAGTDLGDFALEAGGSISGTVVPPPGETLPDGLWVSVESFESGGRHLPGTQVDADTGAYRLRGLPASATYRVQADTWGTDLVRVYYLTATESTFDHGTATAVQVAIGADTSGVDLLLFRGGTISGTVTHASDGSPVAAMPISTHLVDDPLGRGYWENTQTLADGTYTLRRLPSGDYEVWTDARSGPLANQAWPGFVSVSAPGDTPDVDFVLEAAGRITGRVTQVVQGQVEPVVNLRVQAFDEADGRFVSDGYTDANGDYAIEALPQDQSYRVQVATWEGPDPQLMNFIAEYYDDRLGWEEADAVALPAGTPEVTGVDFELALGGAIAGLVTASGLPLQNVWVSANDYGGLGFGNGDRTDHNGFYVIRGLDAGSYRVDASPWPLPYAWEYFDDTSDWNQATPVTVQPVVEGQPIPITDHVDFDLAPAFHVRGRVTEADGVTPLEGLRVDAYGDAYGSTDWTDANGNFDLRELPDGRYDLVVDTEGTDFIRAQREVEVTGADLVEDFTLRLGAVLSGRVTLPASGDGVAGVSVRVDDFQSGWTLASGTTLADGSYEVRGLDVGSYRVYLEPGAHNLVPTYWPGALQHGNAQPLAVPDAGGGTPQDVSGVDFEAIQGSEVRGLVFYDENGNGLQDAGEPGVSGVHVGAGNEDGLAIDWQWAGTQEDGTYVLHGVYPGLWVMSAHVDGTPYAGEWYKLVTGLPLGTAVRSDSDRVDTTAGDVSGVDFSLGLGGGITGTVRDTVTGDPIGNVDVWVESMDGEGLWNGQRTGQDGRYLIRGLPAGDYRVNAWDNHRGVYVGEYHDNAFFWEDATPAVVLARSSPTDPLATQVDFDLAEGGAVEGVVYADANGNGVRDAGEAGIGGARVRVDEHAQPHRYLSEGQTEADGSYRVGGLPPGLDLRLEADPWPTDFLRVYWDAGDDRGTPDGEAAAAVTVTSGGTTAGISFGLALGGAISGTVRGGDGQPLAGYGVNAATPSWQWFGGSTEADGRYTIHGLEAGTYRVTTGDGERSEWYDDQEDWRAATLVTVGAGTTAGGVDFVLPVVPRIVAGPTPASGERGATLAGVTVIAERLTATTRLDFGAGLTAQNLVLDAPSGTFTFDLQIAADAPLGTRSLSLLNDQLVEDGAAILADAFTVLPAAGDVPAPHGQRLYAADNGLSQLRVYAATDLTLLGTIDVCANPAAVVPSDDHRFVYVNCGDRSLSVVDTRLGAYGQEVARLLTIGAFGQQAIDAGGDTLYAVNREFGKSEVHVVDLRSFAVTSAIEVGMAPWALRLAPDGKVLWVLHRNDHQLSLVDTDPASPTFHQVLGTFALPGSSPRGLAFISGGDRAWVVGNRETYVVDTAKVLADPANAVTAVLATQGSGRGVVEIVPDAGLGVDLAYVSVNDTVWVFDASTDVDAPRLLRTFTAGLGLNGLAVGDGRLFLAHDTSLDFHAVDTAALTTDAALAVYRFDTGDATTGPPLSGPATPSGGLALVTATPPAQVSPPVVGTVTGPVANGADFTVTVTGSGFAAAPVVSLQGTHARGEVLQATASQLQVRFPAATPAGSHTLVVTNPAAGGGDSALSPSPLVVTPPATFDTNQSVFVSAYGSSRVEVLEAGGGRATVPTQPYPAGLALTPDGRLGFVVQLYGSRWTTWDDLPASYLDLSVVDLDPTSVTYGEVVATVPWVWSSFSSPAVTPDPGDPDGVLVFAPNYYLADTVSVIDPLTLSEVDLDDDPSTQSIPPDDPYTWIYGQKLPGLSRIELDAQVTDGNLGPTDTALTADGSYLYVGNQAGSVSIVDTSDFSVEPQRLTANGDLGYVRGLVVTPGVTAGALLSVAGLDSTGVPSLFVFETGIFDDSALVDQIVLPTNELPREIAIASDGTVYLTARLLGELWAVDVKPSSRGKMNWGQIERIPLAPGIHEMAEAEVDQLLYVSNGFRAEVYVLSLAQGKRHDLVTTLHVPGSPGAMAVEPLLASDKVQVTSVTPNHGLPAGGTVVWLSGLNFAAGATVEFGGVAAASVTVTSPFLIRATTPPGALGAVDVKVKVGNRFGVLSSGFTYALDTLPPVFTTPPWVASQSLAGAPGAETVTAELRWRTDEAADALVEYRRLGDPSFLQQSDAALVRDHVLTLPDLDPATDYEYRVTSADASGNPRTTALLGFTTLTAPDLLAPVILQPPQPVSLTTDSALIRWLTDESSTSVVLYDDQPGGGFTRQANGLAGTTHDVSLVGLQPNTTYELKAVSVDASGNAVESAVDTFTTLALPDTTPPAIVSGPGVIYLTSDLVAVHWRTDEESTSFVNYGVSSTAEQGVIDVDLVTDHVVFLTNLLPGTAYGYQAGSTDASGNTVVTADPFAAGALVFGPWTTKAAVGFTTPETPDTTAPTVLVLDVSALAHDRARVAVTVDEAASLGVRFAGRTVFQPAFSTTPSLVLTGLTAATTYPLELELTDPKGNVRVVSATVTTPALPDTTPPVLSGLAVTPTATSARIAWQTDEPADAAVRFGVSSPELRLGRPTLATAHELTLTGLKARTSYVFEAQSRDSSGNAAVLTGTFQTPALEPLISSVTPPRATQGQTLRLVVAGLHFGPDTQLSLGPGVTVTGLSVNTAGSQLEAAVTVAPAAAVGVRQLQVTTGGHTVTAPFAVVDETVPVLTITEPQDGDELSSRTVVVHGTVSEPAEVTVNGVAAILTGLAFEATVTLSEAGQNRVVATAVDASGNRGVAVVVLAVVITDTEPPVLVLTAEPSVLWPPNHKMVPVVVDVVVRDDQDPSPVVELVAVTSNEPDDDAGSGDGATTNDIQDVDLGADDREVLLRAERDGKGDGRVYTLTYRASDAVGNASEASVHVVVPLSQGKGD